MRSTGLSDGEILRVVNLWIGVAGGWLGDFVWRTLDEFFPLYCDLATPHLSSEGHTKRTWFIQVLKEATPREQAAILRGVLQRYPEGSEVPPGSQAQRTATNRQLIERLVARLDAQSDAIGPPQIASPSEAVREALEDARTLIESGRPTSSAVDRIHTALHGYLEQLCLEAGIEWESRRATPAVFLSRLREAHPALSDLNRTSARVLRGINLVLEGLQDARDNRSRSHPREALDEIEAALLLDAAHSVWRYLEAVRHASP